MKLKIQTELQELSLKRFREFMNARESKDYDDFIDKSIAALSDSDLSDIEELDIAIYKELVKEYKLITQDSLMDSLLSAQPIDSFNEFKVAYDENGQLFLKRSEQKYLNKLLHTGSMDESINSKIMCDNMHIVAAILFRPEGTSDKFNEESIHERAKLFEIMMPIKTMFPFLKLISEKLQLTDELESSNS